MKYQIYDIVRLKKTKIIKTRLRGKKAKILEIGNHDYTARIGKYEYVIHPWMIAYKLKRG